MKSVLRFIVAAWSLFRSARFASFAWAVVSKRRKSRVAPAISDGARVKLLRVSAFRYLLPDASTEYVGKIGTVLLSKFPSEDVATVVFTLSDEQIKRLPCTPSGKVTTSFHIPHLDLALE